MRDTCINHPASEPLIIIRKWQIEACDDNQCGAALLSYFEYWHNIRLSQSGRSQRSNEIAEAHGDQGTQDTSLYQFHTEQDLEEGILLYKRSAISKAIAILIEKGFVSVHKNPNPRYKFDRTRYFLFHPDKVNQWIDDRSRSRKNNSSSPENNGRCDEIKGQSVENEARSVIFGRAITEITPEITSETTHTKSASPKAEKSVSEEVASLPKQAEPVQLLPVNPNRKPEGSQETQERIGGDQSSAAKKICEGELTTHKQEQLTPTPRRYRSGVQKAEDRFREKTYPWEIAPGKPNPDFVAFMAKQLPSNGEANPLLKASLYVINHRVSDDGIEKLTVSWDFFTQELEQRRQAEEMRKASPAINEAAPSHPTGNPHLIRLSPEESAAGAARMRAMFKANQKLESDHGRAV